MSLNTHSYDNNTAYIRLDGEDIENGSIDIQSALSMVKGSHDTIHYLLKKSDSTYAKTSAVNFPIKTREGCWEILINSLDPSLVGVAYAAGGFMLGTTRKALTVGATKYVEGFVDNINETRKHKNVYKDVFEQLMVLIKIAKHLGTTDKRSGLDTRVIDRDTVYLRNDKGRELKVRSKDIELYTEAPKKLVELLASVVTDERSLTVGYTVDGRHHSETIDYESRDIFIFNEDERTPILPELSDGQYVELIGNVTKGNQESNTIGFKYQGHVITCEPANQKLITGYVEQHYKPCKIFGYIKRTPQSEIENGRLDRPRIYFTNLVLWDASGNESLPLA